MPQQILKRDGTLHPWDDTKITKAIAAAMKSEGIIDYSDKAVETTKTVLAGFNGHKIMPQEKVQDLVETSLMQTNPGAAKKFIIYREKRRQQRETQNTFLDVTRTIDDYIGNDDWRVNENANMDFSFLVLDRSYRPPNIHQS